MQAGAILKTALKAARLVVLVVMGLVIGAKASAEPRAATPKVIAALENVRGDATCEGRRLRLAPQVIIRRRLQRASAREQERQPRRRRLPNGHEAALVGRTRLR